jgi:hypothetical protein
MNKLRFDVNNHRSSIDKEVQFFLPTDNELTIVEDFSDNQQRMRSLDRYYSNMKFTNFQNHVSSLIADPSSDRFLIFQLLDGSVGQYDIIKDKITKFYQIKSNHLSCKMIEISFIFRGKNLHRGCKTDTVLCKLGWCPLCSFYSVQRNYFFRFQRK